MSTRSFKLAIHSVVLVWLAMAIALLGGATIAFAHGGGGGGGGGGHGGGGGGHGGSFGGHASFGGSFSGGRSFSASSFNGAQHFSSSFAPAMSGQHFNSAVNQHSSSWANGQNWSHHSGNWNGWNHYPWGHSFYNHAGWWPGWGFSFGLYPWFWYGGYGSYWPDYYAAYGDYCYDYAQPADYGYVNSPNGINYSAGYRGLADNTYWNGQSIDQSSVPPGPVDGDQPPITANANDRRSAEALQYYSEAREAFTKGDYHEAQRLASHAAVEAPQNPKVHEMISLSLFASGAYLDAARAAHLALVTAPPSDWKNLYSYYGDVDKYTSQLRQLEKTVHDEPNGAAGRFLLGYHYLMTGANEQAKHEFQAAAKLTPGDKLASHILKELNSGQSVVPPTLPAPPAAATPAPTLAPSTEGPKSGQEF